MNLNKVLLIGRLTRDPEMRNIPSGHPVCSFGIATNRVWTDASGEKQERTEFHNIVAWRRLAEICGQYLSKGKLVHIEGRLETRSWQDQDGNKRYRTEIIAENMQMGPRLAGTINPEVVPTEEIPEEGAEIPEESSSVLASSKATAGKKSSKDKKTKKEAEEKPDEEEMDVKDIPF